MSGKPLLVTFCNQITSPRYAGGILDRDGEGWRWLPLAELDITDPGNSGLCGACRVGDQLVVATQTTPPLLVRFDAHSGRFTARRVLDACSDIHSVIWWGGALYVVSTGTNEIYTIPLDDEGFGEPRLHWRYPGLAPHRDLVHLNGLTASTEGLIASCFGPKSTDNTWSSDGHVFRVEPFEVICGGLSHPHSPLCCDDRLFFTQSGAHRVHTMHRDRDGQWREEQSIDVGGYARGLAYEAGQLWVGISAERRISRSKRTPNPGVTPSGGAAILCIDLATRTVSQRRDLGGFGEEIYELLGLGDVEPLDSIAVALTQRILNMQSVAATVRADYAAAFQSLSANLKREQSAAETVATEL